MSKSLFQKVLDGEVPMPNAAGTLGASITDIDMVNGAITVEFKATDAFTNPIGDVQGGFLAAMLDDTMGPALVCTLGPNEFAPTLELKVNFIRPAKVGLITGYGLVVSKGSSICVLEGELRQDDALIAKSSATALIRKVR